MPTLRIPAATYRLQFNGQFRFGDAQRLVDYLHQLGATDIYASPLLQARHGSSHGYDVTDPSHLNAEIGNERELETLIGELRQRGMGLLLDIVPNHMAASSENPWWMDVLENGPSSPYAPFFDIDWHPPRAALRNKVLLPILGKPYAKALENKELKLVFELGSFFIQYYETKLPVAPKSYSLVLRHRLGELQQKLGPDHQAFRELDGILAAVDGLPERNAPPTEAPGERRLQREAIKERLRNLDQSASEIHDFLEENIRIFNGRKKNAASFIFLDRLLADQAYVLSYWLSVTEEINYRRFFTISDLVGVRTEDPLVFEATHAVILRLIENGLVTGLRIDHVDGLRDPLGYLRRLQERLGFNAAKERHPGFYVIVEKIFSGKETLRPGWPICGTTGYDFLNTVNGIFLDPGGCKEMDRTYQAFVQEETGYADLALIKKIEVMESLLAVEMRSLGHYVGLLAEQDRYARDLPQAHLARALILTTACLPVYRTYIRGLAAGPGDRRCIEQALQKAREINPGLRPASFDFLEDVLLLRDRVHVLPEQREARLAFVMRWQQFTGPITAKGVEDSSLYIYNRLISLNEVGGDPASTGISVETFHEFCGERQRHARHTLNATTTHDTKRSEDVRARINVLSEMPKRWQEWLNRWARWNHSKKKSVDGWPVPDPNEEIHLYQTMLGAWPLDEREVPDFRRRLQDYMIKAIREAMVHTKWMRPNVKHERALRQFINSITEPKANPFLEDFLKVQGEVAHYGAINSLSQLLLKLTAPGVPDLYQGSELWDLRLVDPDNRGPVDFERCSCLLDSLNRRKQEHEYDPWILAQDMLDHWRDGRVKLYLTSKALNFRRLHPVLFLEGAYEALPVAGPKKENVCAFMRHAKKAWAITAVPRLVTKLAPAGKMPTGADLWQENVLVLPKDSPEGWTNVLTGETLKASPAKQGLELQAGEAFSRFPVALLAAQVG